MFGGQMVVAVVCDCGHASIKCLQGTVKLRGIHILRTIEVSGIRSDADHVVHQGPIRTNRAHRALPKMSMPIDQTRYHYVARGINFLCVTDFDVGFYSDNNSVLN